MLGAMCLLVPLGQRTAAASNPPVGTLWEENVQTNPGEPGELNVRWSVRLESANTQTVALRYTFQGEVGFITDQVCNNPSSIPLPWDRLAVRATLSGGGTSAPSTFADESLATAKLDYQAPAFVNCWAMVNPPPAYPSAVSYVRYSGYRFSAIHSGIPIEFFSKLSTVDLSATNNSSPAASNFVGTSISIPVVGVDPETTTSKPQTTTTRAGVGTTPVENTAVVTTTTLPVEVVETTIPIDGVVPDAVGGVTDIGAGEDNVDVSYDMKTESPAQEEERKKDTANSLAVTAAVLFSSLAAAAPTLGAVSAAGAVGGVIGVTASRTLSGGQLLPQVPKPTEIEVDISKSRTTRNSEKPPDVMSSTDVVLENAFATPSIQSAAQGGVSVVGIDHVGRVFASVIFSLQFFSRVHIFRPGLRRWAEIALVSPALAVVLPVSIASSSAVLAVLLTEGMISSTIAIVGLFALSILAPVFSVITILGWCVGRVFSPSGSLFLSVAEGVALLPGLLLLPLMLRNLIGPRRRSRPWEYKIALLLAPCVAALAYRNWLLHFSDVTGSLSRKLVTTFGGNDERRVLEFFSEATVLAVGAFMAMCVMLIAVLAVRYSDDEGKPDIMFRRFVQTGNPTQILRREYIDLATIAIKEPGRWGRWSRYVLAGLLTTYALSEFLGMRSIILVMVFFVGFAVAKRISKIVMKNEVHPIVKTLPMVGLGLLLGAISVSANSAFIAFALVAVLAVAGSLIRTRTLWDS